MCTPIRRGKKVELLYPFTFQLENTLLFSDEGIQVTRWWCRVPFEGRTEEHVRSHHSMIIVRQGSYLLESARGRGLIDSTSVGLYNPGEPFTGSHPNGCGDDGWAVLLTPDLVRPLLRRHRPWLADSAAPAFPSPAGCLSASTRLRHRLLMTRIEQGEDALSIGEAVQGLLAEMACSLFEPSRRPVAADPEDAEPRPYVERAALYLARSFRQPVQLADVAQAAYTSTFHLCRLFKAQTGTTIHRYLTRLRLNAALDELAQPKNDIWQIARDVGFVAHSHFTAAFRREFGCTPSQARRALSSRSEREHLRARLPRLAAPLSAAAKGAARSA